MKQSGVVWMSKVEQMSLFLVTHWPVRLDVSWLQHICLKWNTLGPHSSPVGGSDAPLSCLSTPIKQYKKKKKRNDQNMQTQLLLYNDHKLRSTLLYSVFLLSEF